MGGWDLSGTFWHSTCRCVVSRHLPPVTTSAWAPLITTSPRHRRAPASGCRHPSPAAICTQTRCRAYLFFDIIKSTCFNRKSGFLIRKSGFFKIGNQNSSSEIAPSAQAAPSSLVAKTVTKIMIFKKSWFSRNHDFQEIMIFKKSWFSWAGSSHFYTSKKNALFICKIGSSSSFSAANVALMIPENATRQRKHPQNQGDNIQSHGVLTQRTQGTAGPADLDSWIYGWIYWVCGATTTGVGRYQRAHHAH